MHDGPNDRNDDACGEAYESYFMTPEQREQRRLARKPPIDHLPDGVATLDDGTVLPLFGVGDRIVAERRTSFLAGTPWLDTRVYVVRSIDHEKGEVRCTDEEMGHYACVGFRHPFTRIKLAPRKGDPFRVPRRREKRGEEPPPGPGERKRRGRPKGSKNRPKEVIEAEKRAKRAKREKRNASRRRKGEKGTVRAG